MTELSKPHRNLIKKLEAYAEAYAYQMWAIDQGSVAEMRKADKDFKKTQGKLQDAFKKIEDPQRSFAIGDVLKPTKAFLARVNNCVDGITIMNAKFPYVVTSAEVTETGIQYKINHGWFIDKSEWRLVRRADAESLAAVPVKLTVPPGTFVQEPKAVQVKKVCITCSYFNNRATNTYKCCVKGECPALENDFERVSMRPILSWGVLR